MLQVDAREAGFVEHDAQHSPSVLLVQSDTDLRDALTSACEQSGLHVHGCATVALAQEACRQREMDLLIVDWVVEGIFADDLLKLLTAARHPRPLPTTLLLSRMDNADTRDCLRPDIPIHGVLTRPTDAAEFTVWAPKFAEVLKKCQRPRARKRAHV
jgi:DNA-binding response OmpR family regulator